MASNSIRVDAVLFDTARRQGKIMSRSAAQQLEHWARLGVALEAVGLSVGDVAAILAVARGRETNQVVSEQELWAHKRSRQARDIANVNSGRATNAQMSWFSGGRARTAKLLNSPY